MSPSSFLSRIEIICVIFRYTTWLQWLRPNLGKISLPFPTLHARHKLYNWQWDAMRIWEPSMESLALNPHHNRHDGSFWSVADHCRRFSRSASSSNITVYNLITGRQRCIQSLTRYSPRDYHSTTRLICLFGWMPCLCDGIFAGHIPPWMDPWPDMTHYMTIARIVSPKGLIERQQFYHSPVGAIVCWRRPPLTVQAWGTNAICYGSIAPEALLILQASRRKHMLLLHVNIYISCIMCLTLYVLTLSPCCCWC